MIDKILICILEELSIYGDVFSQEMKEDSGLIIYVLQKKKETLQKLKEMFLDTNIIKHPLIFNRLSHFQETEEKLEISICFRRIHNNYLKHFSTNDFTSNLAGQIINKAIENVLTKRNTDFSKIDNQRLSHHSVFYSDVIF